MENGLWNGKLLIATQIAKRYQIEKEVRKASGRKELLCPDPNCQHPILRYCHGDIKDAYFAHRNNECCDYADFDKGNSQIIRTIRKVLYEHFIALGYQVRPEVKVLDHHYTHLLFNMTDGGSVAVEIGTQQLSANHIDYLTEEYKKKNIAVKWIVIGNTEATVCENQTFFLKRYLLNESTNKDLFVIRWDGSQISQYKRDLSRYDYHGRSLKSDNYPDIFVDSAPLSKLVFDGNEISVKGFTEKYEAWICKKHLAFDKRVIELDNESRIHREQQELMKKSVAYTSYPMSTTKNSQNQICCITAAAKKALKEKSSLSYTPLKYENRIEFQFLAEKKLFSTKKYIAENVSVWYDYCFKKGLQEFISEPRRVKMASAILSIRSSYSSLEID